MRYIPVAGKDLRMFEKHERFGECIYCMPIPGHPVTPYTYMIPEDLYEEILMK